MTCKDCIHEQCCKIWEPNEKYFEKANENDCVAFKNKADFVEVKHGKWYRHNKKEHGDTCYYCSVCEKMALSDCMEWELTKYCPNCGADMRKPKNDKE